MQGARDGDDYLRNRVKKAVSGSLKRLGLRRTKSYLCYLGTNSWFPVLDHLKSKRQHWNAQQPGAHMTLTNSAIDHIRPVREFQKHGVGAKTLLCNHYTNLQLLQESARGQQLEVRRLVLRGRGAPERREFVMLGNVLVTMTKLWAQHWAQPQHFNDWCSRILGNAQITGKVAKQLSDQSSLPSIWPGGQIENLRSKAVTRDRGLGRDVTSATLDSGRGITGGGSGYAAIWRTRKEFCTVWNSAR